ncbi:uncharacterized protein [Miscanthus floridulus]|uniref:uncharacterized protein n=1 Tax=Miscanthus floridulus TaxID=154761 RepID=UPI00345983D6
MPAGGAEARWRGRRGGDGITVESAVTEEARQSAGVESYRGTAVRPSAEPARAFPSSLRLGRPNQAAAQQRASALFPSLLSPTRGAQPSASSSPASQRCTILRSPTPLTSRRVPPTSSSSHPAPAVALPCSAGHNAAAAVACHPCRQRSPWSENIGRRASSCRAYKRGLMELAILAPSSSSSSATPPPFSSLSPSLLCSTPPPPACSAAPPEAECRARLCPDGAASGRAPSPASRSATAAHPVLLPRRSRSRCRPSAVTPLPCSLSLALHRDAAAAAAGVQPPPASCFPSLPLPFPSSPLPSYPSSLSFCSLIWDEDGQSRSGEPEVARSRCTGQ